MIPSDQLDCGKNAERSSPTREEISNIQSALDGLHEAIGRLSHMTSDVVTSPEPKPENEKEENIKLAAPLISSLVMIYNNVWNARNRIEDLCDRMVL